MRNSLRKQGSAGLISWTGLAALMILVVQPPARAEPDQWRHEWPNTDFDQTSVPFDEIMSGGPTKDGIPSIDSPRFVPVSESTTLKPEDPVIGLVINSDARAYPLAVLTWHEIANDVVGGVPVAVTYCPLCNSAIVFDRRIEGEVTEFGTTGKLRKSDMVMYDRATESWWQQFLGEAIVGTRTGTQLKMVPARLDSWQRFAARHPDGKVLIPNDPNIRPYGLNPYAGYDTRNRPYFSVGPLPKDLPALARVIKVGERAWLLKSLQEKGQIKSGDLVLTWEAGQRSALDSRTISDGREIGNVVVQRQGGGGLQDEVYDVTFAFVFHAFFPDSPIHR